MSWTVKHSDIAIMLGVMDCDSGIPVLRDDLYDQEAGAENQVLSPGLEIGLELGGPNGTS
jgi:hypothetical protein